MAGLLLFLTPGLYTSAYKHLSAHTPLHMINWSSSMFAWCARTNEVHSRVTQHVWASASWI